MVVVFFITLFYEKAASVYKNGSRGGHSLNERFKPIKLHNNLVEFEKHANIDATQYVSHITTF